MKRSLSAFLAVLLSLLALGAPSSVRATDLWFNPSTGNYSTAGNWKLSNGSTSSTAPTAADDVWFGEYASPVTVNFTANAAAYYAQVVKGTATFNLNGRTWAIGTEFKVGYFNGSGTANFNGGALNTQTLNVGLYTTGVLNLNNTTLSVTGVGDYDNYIGAGGGTGTVNVNSGSTWNSTYMLLSDSSGSTGSLKMNSGGIVSAYVIREGSGNLGSVIFNGGTLRARESNSEFLADFEVGDVQIQSGGAFIDSNGYNIGISTALQGSGSLTKQGGGTLTLTGTSSYSGSTFIEGGTVQISAGSVTSGGVTNIGNDSGSQGTVTVSGGTLNSTSYLRVGYLGTGTLNVSSGSVQANNGIFIGDDPGGSGTMNVSGGTVTSSTEISVGANSTGSLMLTGGAVSNVTGIIGRSTGSSGTATVTGSGSQWTSSGGLYVGHDGVGTLNVEVGGLVATASAYIGYSSGGVGTMTVAGTGSQLVDSGVLNVGYSGSGTLNIQNGGLVSNTFSYIGRAGGSTGTVTVTGAGSQWTNTQPDLVLGSSGTGTLTVDAGGKVTAPDVIMAFAGSGKGTLNLNGTSGSRGVLETGYLSEGSGSQGATINFNGGILKATGNQSNFLQSFETGDVQIQSGGAFVDTQNFNVGIATAMQGSGGLTKDGTGTLTLTGTNTYTGTTTVNRGTLDVNKNGTTTFGTLGSGATTVSGAASPVGNGPELRFLQDASAESGSFTNDGGAVSGANGGGTSFNNTSTAGNGSFINNVGAVSDAGVGRTFFNNTSTAGNGTFTNNGGVTSHVSGGYTYFNNASTAASGSFINNGGGISGAVGGATYFNDTSTAGSSTLTANGGSNGGSGGRIFFWGDSTGGTATVKAYGNGFLDIASHNAGSVGIGSLEGSGNVILGSNQLNMGGNNASTEFSGVASGSGGSLAKTGSGTTTISGTNTYTGATMVLQGKVLVDGSIAASSSVDVSSGATLGGHGAVSTITGAGTVSAGNSPGILTATVIDPSGGLDFLFEMTQTGSPFYDQAAASGNDVLRLTGATPFTSALGAGNLITVDFTGYGALSSGQVFRGGFYTNNGGDFYSYLQNASFNYLGLGAGESVLLSTVLDSANFAGGTSNGYVTQFTIVVPEPSRVMLLVVGLTGGLLRRRRKNV